MQRKFSLMIAQTTPIFRWLPGLLIAICVAGCGSQGSAGLVRETSQADEAVRVALQQVGTPYRYGGSSPSGFDCSGLVHYSYALAGKSVPRTTGSLWAGTRAVDANSLRSGDILFFRIAGKMSHVGMYIGDDKFVHAPSSGKVVSVASLESAFYRHAFIRGGRPD